MVDEGLGAAFRAHPKVASAIPGLLAEVEEQKTTPAAAARALLALFRG